MINKKILDHDKEKVLRMQAYWRGYQGEKDMLNRHLKFMKEKFGVNKSEWIRHAILDAIIKEKRNSSKGVYKKEKA